MGNYDRDLSTEEVSKCKSDVIKIEEDCNSQMFLFAGKYGGQPKYIQRDDEKLIGEHELKHFAHFRSGSDFWAILNNLPIWFIITNIMKTTKGFVSKIFNRFHNVKANFKGKPQYINHSMHHSHESLGIQEEQMDYNKIC